MSFLKEIKRRKVFQIAAMYAVVAWLLIQIITSVEGPLNLPDWTDTFVIVLLAFGFPVALVLAWVFDVTPQGIKPTARVQHAGTAPRSPIATFTYVSQGLVLLAVAFLVADQYVLEFEDVEESRSPVGDVIRYNYRLQEGESLMPARGVSIAVSPDGARVAYVGPGPAAGGSLLWVRERDQLQSIPVLGSENALHPFFAPDGRGLGFVTEQGELKIISRMGDPPLTIVDEAVYRFGAAWGVDGNVYFSGASGLLRKPATGGGDPKPVTRAERIGSSVVYHGWPEVLPNGKGMIFTILRDHLADEIALVDFSTGEVRTIAEGEIGRYSESGHLIYVRQDGGLMAVRFDQDRMLTHGPEVRLNDHLSSGFGQDIALSRTGRLLYTRSNTVWEVVWVDRDGSWAPIDPDQPIRGIRYVALSPDDSLLAVSTWPLPGSDNGHVWIKQLPLGPFAQFTFEGDVNMRPSWSPDGRSVVFISDRGDNRDAWLKRSDGTGPAELLLDDEAVVDEILYSPTGEWLVYRRGKEDGDRDIYAVRSGGGIAPRTMVASGFDEVAPALSLDSRWLAYVSNRGGKPNVYIRPFPEADTEKLVSVNGGTEPVWSRNASELYYRNGDGDLVMVELSPGPELQVGPERVLFSATAYRSDFYHAAYDVTSDGQRFVMIRASESGSREEELIVVENWFQELGRLAPLQ